METRMSVRHRQWRRRFPVRFWTVVFFKTVVAVGQVAYLIVKLLSLSQ
jgi:hypothetical protein